MVLAGCSLSGIPSSANDSARSARGSHERQSRLHGDHEHCLCVPPSHYQKVQAVLSRLHPLSVMQAARLSAPSEVGHLLHYFVDLASRPARSPLHSSSAMLASTHSSFAKRLLQ